MSKRLKSLIFFNEPKKDEGYTLQENTSESMNVDHSKEPETDSAGDGSGMDSADHTSEATPKGDSEVSTVDASKFTTKGTSDNSKKRKKNQSLLLKKESEQKDDSSKTSKDVDAKVETGKKENKPDSDSPVSDAIAKNISFMKATYNIPLNGDIVLREFDVMVKDKVIPAFIIFIDGMTDRNIIHAGILQPLMLLSTLEIKDAADDLAAYIKNHLLPHNQIKEASSMSEVIEEINFGGCGIFIDGLTVAFAADVKGWEHRTVGRPNTELVLRGPQEGFTENLRTNTALLRRILLDEDMIIESMTIGKRSKTPCAMIYIRDIANNSLVDEIRKRLKNIYLDYIFDSGELEQLLEEDTYMPTPQVLATERPDRAASMLAEGKVVVILNGSPFVLIMPTTNFDLLKSTEDNYIRFPYANLVRLVRLIATILTLLLPGLYVAVTNFHQEMLPTDLLLAISAAREKVPFPSVIEILLMEFAFELIREAGIRIPGPVGPTLGIIGALILGQAAVAASIVSPILIIIVAVTGIGSFAMPNFSLGLSLRILRFGYILLAAMAGFLGITMGLFIHGLFLVSAKSFGVPFLAPVTPKTNGGVADSFFRGPIWKQEKRPDYLNPKDKKKQPEYSRKWKFDMKGGGESGEH